MTYGYFTADISTDAAYARPTDLRKSGLSCNSWGINIC